MFSSLSLLSFLLFATCIFSVITFYITYRIKTPESFKKVLLFTIALIITSSINDLLLELMEDKVIWKEHLSPFFLMYGPVLYFGLVALRDGRVAMLNILAHSLPFILCSMFHIYLRCSTIPDVKLITLYSNNIFTVCAISFISYTFISFYKGRKLFVNQYRDKMLIFVFGRILLLFLGMMFIFLSYTKSPADNLQTAVLLKLVVYFCLFIFIAMVFNFSVNKLLNKFPADLSANLDAIPLQVIPEMKYGKSALTSAQLENYEQKLTDAMLIENVFLDVNLSLSSLAQHLRIPNHHLTQVLSLQTQQTFYQYINGYRVEYACNLLSNSDIDIKVEELSEQCGFNSKASFNRQFKQIMNCTPSAYKSGKAIARETISKKQSGGNRIA